MITLTPIPESGFKHLGIPTNKSGHYFDEAEHLARAASIASKLKNLHLSIFGIKRIIHSYIFSSISYQLFIIQPRKPFFKSLFSIISKFIWNGRAKVSNKRLCQNYANGGIGLFNME